MESIDRLLAELRAEYQESQKKSADLKRQRMVQPEPSLQATTAPSSQVIETSGKNLDFDNLDSDLAQIKAEYQGQEPAQKVAKQERVLAEDEAQNKDQKTLKQEPQQVEVKTHREKVRQAQVWLKNLSKDSDERFWFDQFAFKYSSRIDAAIDYLQVVNEFD
ncbi:MAG: hypothetical protein EAZ78_01620 [Oscillatoriales cyanobacterium]|uniref:Uncharacterized protein n=1 Tax=Microcoleus anatoxicus PTRS2 TaxID=2705321 RepID=A0ABU8YH55_9CYAN|nr:MAG: hypothetical protein EA000_23135 [Oscillatoriales cyanobacterium]TAD96669.1 MAG: hypothetical protein EAZ98_11955 [Oscillatoriales cyanobacterium]TAE01207.1 MAG: hypothetical protein EAZ96_19720 [Oscillatoriales cyanobacterium]TAF06790.1 MAG: hypothetical protein EAZ78_01620 [Oscillatoriales cyanobacterium]TAF34888.1 MAG: hypothetical protein EAZ68_18740 [Oscillatoriales cyanobacterium]